MREAPLVVAAVGRLVVACYVGKTPDHDWGEAVVAVFFGGSAGALVAAAIE